MAHDNRRFLNAVFWILRTGAPWRDLPPDYGDWKNTHRRFCRWRDKGIWEGLLERLIDDPDYELADDQCHPLQGPSARGWRTERQPGHRPYKRGLNTKVHLAVDARGMLVRITVTEATPGRIAQRLQA